MNRPQHRAEKAALPRSRPSFTSPWRPSLAVAALLAVSGCGSDIDRANEKGNAALSAERIDVESYALVGEFDWKQRVLRAKVTVTLAADKTVPSTLVLDSRVKSIKSVTTSGGQALAFRVDAQANTVSIELGALAVPGVSVVIDYEAEATFSGGVLAPALSAFGERRGDPLQSRAAYTFSEPLSARAWMPSHDDVADRAQFSAEFRLSDGDRLIANGDLVQNQRGQTPGERRMKYQTAYSLPTYLMAVAVGQFEVERSRGPRGLPLSVWHRPGVVVDAQTTMRRISKMIESFEALTRVDYPFEKYALVLLPNFPGGEEHASITFQGETLSTQPNSVSELNLIGHELGHQWFGDLTTVATWDDVWLKEGMATVMEWESVRASLDESGPRGLDGDRNFVRSGQAIRDINLPPEEKYGTGPYTRAAWLLSQIRTVAGEQAFWGTWKKLLDENRFGTLSTEQFLTAFSSVLPASTLAAVRTAIDAQRIPSLGIVQNGETVTVTLQDPDGALIIPMEATWIRANGSRETFSFPIGQPVELKRNDASDLLVIDEGDVHPAWTTLVARNQRPAYTSLIAPLLVPVGEAQRERFVGLKAVHQVAALQRGPAVQLEPAQLEDFLTRLDSDAARGIAVRNTCTLAQQNPDAWKETLQRVLRFRPYLSSLSYTPFTYDDCAKLFAPKEIRPWAWLNLQFGLPFPLIDEREVDYLAKFPTKAEDMRTVWSAVAQNAYSLKARERAATTLSNFAFTPGNIADAELPAWRQTAAKLLSGTEVVNPSFDYVAMLSFTAASTATDNAQGLDALATALRSQLLGQAHGFATCTAYQLAAGDDVAWNAFRAQVESATLSDSVRAILADPATACGGGQLRAQGVQKPTFFADDGDSAEEFGAYRHPIFVKR